MIAPSVTPPPSTLEKTVEEMAVESMTVHPNSPTTNHEHNSLLTDESGGGAVFVQPTEHVDHSATCSASRQAAVVFVNKCGPPRSSRASGLALRPNPLT
ncbi:unnamed protein product [Menidia menidia]|uniref:(Atlantic silverside) hypothetical protein n=1 Tax=Menidia menidia TaxID=238744 RepID=A0A8S4BSM6_9TELE|nr:unnamed protein product [Menidia menidia]